jgi:hypothetical protein
MKLRMVLAPKGRLLMLALTALPLYSFGTETVTVDTSTHYEEVYHESGGSATVGGERVDYVSVAGTIMIEDRKDEPGALMSYVAYFRKNAGAAAKRPITFFYNGGPGSATVWLHLCAFGPKRVAVGDVRSVAAPYELVNNEFSVRDTKIPPPMDIRIPPPVGGHARHSRVGARPRVASNFCRQNEAYDRGGKGDRAAARR